MKAIKINSKNKTIEQVEVKDWRDISPLIGCGTFTVAMVLENEDTIYVDDEGLLTLGRDSTFFEFEGGHQPFAGNGLILGCDEEGESCDVKASIEEIKNKVKFLSIEDVYLRGLG